MYNFGVPSQLKAWIDRLLVAGKTFRHSESGVEGLASGKRVVIANHPGDIPTGTLREICRRASWEWPPKA